jgi:hypothetical protein
LLGSGFVMLLYVPLLGIDEFVNRYGKARPLGRKRAARKELDRVNIEDILRCVVSYRGAMS